LTDGPAPRPTDERKAILRGCPDASASRLACCV